MEIKHDPKAASFKRVNKTYDLYKIVNIGAV